MTDPPACAIISLLTPEQALDYSGYDAKELNMTFTFDHCWENGAFGAENKSDDEIATNLLSLKNVISKWQLGLYGKGWNPLYWLNHDHPRVASQYGDINYHKESCKKCRIQPTTGCHESKSVVVREWNRRKEGEQK